MILLWAGFLAGPAAFLIGLQLAYMAVPWECARGTRGVLVHLAHLATLLLALAGAFISWRSWRKAGRQWPGSEGGPVARGRFLATLGAVGSAFFALIIIGQWAASFFLGPCHL